MEVNLETYDLIIEATEEKLLPEVSSFPVQYDRISVRKNAIRFWNTSNFDLEELRQKYAIDHLDINAVPSGLSIKDFRFFAFDMDGTLIRQESLDELARFCGIDASFSQLTRDSMAGKIDFEASLRQRIHFFKGIPERILIEKLKDIEFSPGGEELIQFIKTQGLYSWIVTGGFDTQASFVAKKLAMDGYCCNKLSIKDAHLTGEIEGISGQTFIDARGKSREVRRIAEKLGGSIQEAICVGDGANDQFMIQEAGIGVAFHSKPILKTKTTYQINYCGLDAISRFFIEAWQ